MPVRKFRPWKGNGQEFLLLSLGFFFALTFQKYETRDSLSTSAGLQGVLEAIVTLFTCASVVLLTRGRTKRFGVYPFLICLAAYGTFALASSVNSYDPKLSLVKAFLYLAILLTAYCLSETGGSLAFLAGVYRGYTATILGGLALAALSPSKYPLFVVETFNGRTRLHLFDSHPNTIGEVTGLLFLLAQILPIRARWYLQAFLLTINILAGERTATVALLLASGLIFFFGHKSVSRRWVVAAVCAAALCLSLLFVSSGLLHTSSVQSSLQHASDSIYGTKVGDELASLDGRADIWRTGLRLAGDHPLLGFGFAGARDALLSSVSWSGQAHNALLEAALTAGLLGMLLLVAGWLLSISSSLTRDRVWNVKILSFNLFVLCLVMVGPIFDAPSSFTTMLIVIIFYAGKEGRPAFSLRDMPTRVALESVYPVPR